MFLVKSRNYNNVKNKKNSIFHILTKNGIYLHYENDYFRVIKNIFKTYDPEELEPEKIFEKEGIEIKRKIPNNFKQLILNYYNQYNNIEKCLFLTYQQNNPGNIIMLEPEQNSFPSHVDYELDLKDGFLLLATIHNHPMNLNDFSVIDDSDLKKYIAYDILVTYNPRTKEPIISKVRLNILGYVFNININEIFE